MKNNTYKFAGITVNASYETDHLEKQCGDYVTKEAAELYISVSEDDVERERKKADCEGYSYGYLESLAFYRKFCNAAVENNVLLFHSSAIAVDGKAYLFAAPSGTGKSTHTRLWRRAFGERAVTVNDDKPLLRISGNRIVAYGTPWDGKHRLSNNVSFDVAGICFIARGKENSIKRLSQMEALPEFLSQTYRPDSEEGVGKMLELSLSITSNVPMYKLWCNISDEAVRIAYEEMSGNKFD